MGVREVGMEVRRILEDAVRNRMRANRMGWSRINVEQSYRAMWRINEWLQKYQCPGAETLRRLQATLWADLYITLVGNAASKQRRLANIESLINTIHQ